MDAAGASGAEQTKKESKMRVVLRVQQTKQMSWSLWVQRVSLDWH
jgi:hypothetical protein